MTQKDQSDYTRPVCENEYNIFTLSIRIAGHTAFILIYFPNHTVQHAYSPANLHSTALRFSH